MLPFKTFDKGRLEDYAERARAAWGTTDAYREFEARSAGRSDVDQQALNVRMMGIFCEFGRIRGGDPSSPEAKALVERLKGFISDNYYCCTDEILSGLGKDLGCGGEFTRNINEAAGDGAAEFASEAIEAYCATHREA